MNVNSLIRTAQIVSSIYVISYPMLIVGRAVFKEILECHIQEERIKHTKEIIMKNLCNGELKQEIEKLETEIKKLKEENAPSKINSRE